MSQERENLQSEPLEADESSEISEIVEVDEEISSPEGEMEVDADDADLVEQAEALRIGRDMIMRRGWSWITARVPYSQTRTYKNQYGKYRTDCSGFASLSWGLPISYTTRTIMRVAHKIPRDQLRKGDALLRVGSHIAIFELRLDGGKVRVYEQTPPRARRANWSVRMANSYQPIRFNGVQG